MLRTHITHLNLLVTVNEQRYDDTDGYVYGEVYPIILTMVI
jgi:hypothetical protein